MSDLKSDLEAFVHKNGPDIIKRFNEVLQKRPETAGLTVDQARISYAEARDGNGPTVQEVEGGYIIWK